MWRDPMDHVEQGVKQGIMACRGGHCHEHTPEECEAHSQRPVCTAFGQHERAGQPDQVDFFHLSYQQCAVSLSYLQWDGTLEARLKHICCFQQYIRHLNNS